MVITSEIENVLNGTLNKKSDNFKAIGVSSANLQPNEKGIVPLSSQDAFTIVNSAPVNSTPVSSAPMSDVLVAPAVDVKAPTSLDGFDIKPKEVADNLINPMETPEMKEEPVKPVEMPQMPTEIVAQAPIDVNNELFNMNTNTGVGQVSEAAPANAPAAIPVPNPGTVSAIDAVAAQGPVQAQAVAPVDATNPTITNTAEMAEKVVEQVNNDSLTPFSVSAIDEVANSMANNITDNNQINVAEENIVTNGNNVDSTVTQDDNAVITDTLAVPGMEELTNTFENNDKIPSLRDSVDEVKKDPNIPASLFDNDGNHIDDDDKKIDDKSELELVLVDILKEIKEIKVMIQEKNMAVNNEQNNFTVTSNNVNNELDGIPELSNTLPEFNVNNTVDSNPSLGASIDALPELVPSGAPDMVNPSASTESNSIGLETLSQAEANNMTVDDGVIRGGHFGL